MTPACFRMSIALCAFGGQLFGIPLHPHTQRYCRTHVFAIAASNTEALACKVHGARGTCEKVVGAATSARPKHPKLSFGSYAQALVRPYSHALGTINAPEGGSPIAEAESRPIRSPAHMSSGMSHSTCSTRPVLCWTVGPTATQADRAVIPRPCVLPKRGSWMGRCAMHDGGRARTIPT